MNIQYGKEWSSKISGTVFFCLWCLFFWKASNFFFPVVCCRGKIFSCHGGVLFFKKRGTKEKNHSTTNFTRPFFPVMQVQGSRTGVPFSSSKFSILKRQPSMGTRPFDLKVITPPVIPRYSFISISPFFVFQVFPFRVFTPHDLKCKWIVHENSRQISRHLKTQRFAQVHKSNQTKLNF